MGLVVMMPRGKKITDDIKNRIKDMYAQGLKPSEISRALGVSIYSVKKYREVKDNAGKNNKQSNGIIEEQGDKHTVNDPDRSASFNGSETINFVGGKPYMTDKKEDSYQCGVCGGVFTGNPKYCPHCGAELDW